MFENWQQDLRDYDDTNCKSLPLSCTPTYFVSFKLSTALEQRAGVRTVERALAAYRKTLSHRDLILPP